MSAYRQAMLSVAPERLEQFSILMKQDINNKEKRKKSKHSSSRKPKKSSKSSNKDRKRKTSRDRKKSSEKQRKRSGSGELTDASDMEEGGLDLGKELHPLGFFIKDRSALIEEVFSVIKGPKLLSMFPDDNKDIEEMKRNCRAQLEVMSSERIQRVINGEDLDFSSGTDSEEEEEQGGGDDSLQTNFVDSTTSSSACDVIIIPSAPAPSTSSDCEVVSSSKPDAGRRRVSVKRKVVADDVIVIEDKRSDDVVVVTEEEMVEVEDGEYEDMVDEILEETLKPRIEDKRMSQLEVLELEMRARAIKSLAAKRS